MKKPKKPTLKQALNPLVTLRAKTIPSKKKQTNKLACRGQHKEES